MKRILILSLLLVGFSLVSLPGHKLFAIDVLNPGSGCSGGDSSSGCGACNNADASSTPVVCSDNSTGGTNPIFGPDGILTVGIKILSVIVGVAAVIFIVIQGIRIVLSGGDAQSVASARSGIIYALVGLLVAVFAQALVAFVLNKV